MCPISYRARFAGHAVASVQAKERGGSQITKQLLFTLSGACVLTGILFTLKQSALASEAFEAWDQAIGAGLECLLTGLEVGPGTTLLWLIAENVDGKAVSVFL